MRPTSSEVDGGHVRATRSEERSGAAPWSGDHPPDATGWGTAAGIRYLEIVRGGAQPERELPLLLVIHGMGDRPDPKWLQAIDLDPGLPARMLLPQAPTPYGDGYSWFEYPFERRDETATARGIRAAAERLASMLEVVKQQRNTRGRAVISGFSQGGMLSFALALSRPELVEFALPVSGYLPRALWPASPPPKPWSPALHALHGTADAVVSFAEDEKLVAHLRALGHPAELHAFEDVGHVITPSMSNLARSLLSAAVRESAARTEAPPRAR